MEVSLPLLRNAKAIMFSGNEIMTDLDSRSGNIPEFAHF